MLASVQILTIALALVTGCAAQFEVASVTPVVGETITTGVIKYRNGNLYMSGVTLSLAIQWAFDLYRYQISGPSWIYWRPANDQPRFHITAKADPATDTVAARGMAQKLLIERFGLVSHYEDRMQSAYVLAEGLTGLRIERITETDEDSSTTFANGLAFFKAGTIKELCGAVSLTVQEPVVERTSLGEQKFNAMMNLQYEKREDIAPALLASLKGLGFVVTKEKLPVRTLVIDRVEQRPTEN